jgi:hypothetical protein
MEGLKPEARRDLSALQNQHETGARRAPRQAEVPLPQVWPGQHAAQPAAGEIGMNKRVQLTRWGLVAFLIVVALLWRQVFLMTGILWWQAPRPANRPVPPPPVVWAPVNTDWIDLSAFQRAQPVWPLED